jgi:hypothetical protein
MHMRRRSMDNIVRLIPKPILIDLVQAVCELFRHLTDVRLVNRPHLHIVIVDPDWDPENPLRGQGILYETSIGDRNSWRWPYDQYAHDKAREVFVNRCSTSEMRLRPLRLRTGDVILTGGFYLDGLAIGVSGVQGEFDEALSAAIAFLIQAIAKLIVKQHEEADKDYLGTQEITEESLRCA